MTNLQAQPSKAHIQFDPEQGNTWANDFTSLVSPPDVCVEIFDILESHRASATTISEIIALDPNLTARLLRVVNSPFYKVQGKIDTVSRAITIIGITELYNLVIAISAVRSFSNIPSVVVDIENFWRHSLLTGILTRVLARCCNVLHPERLFVAGLLHDIGSLVIYNQAPEEAKVLVLSALGDEDILYKSELKTFGFSHASIGHRLLDSWNLPHTITEAIRCHHTPGEADSAVMESALVHIAEAYANQLSFGSFSSMPASEAYIDPAAWAGCGLDPDELDLERVLHEATEQFNATRSLFGC